MERSRFITIALIALSLVTVFHASYIEDFTVLDVAIIAITVIFVHLTSIFCSRYKLLHAVSPLVSFCILAVIMIFITSSTSLVNVYNETRLGIETIKSANSGLVITTSVLLVYVLLTWCIAEIGETLAQRLHSSSPTIIWYVVVNAFIFAQIDERFIPVVIIALCASIWFYLYAFNWTHEKASAHQIEIPSASKIANSAGYVASFVAVISLSLLVALANFNLPSFAPKNLFEFLNPAPPQSELSPFVGLRGLLNSPTDDVLFTASATETQYFRVNVLDVFTEQTWNVGPEVERSPEIIRSDLETRRVEATINLVSLSDSLLPTFYSVDTISEPNIRFLENSVVAKGEERISQYSITANVPPSVLTPDQIAASNEKPPEPIRSSVSIPKDLDDEIEQQAREIASGKTSIHDQAIALRDFFLDGSFTYDIDVDYTSDVDAMKTFLRERRGYCEQFAATYAAMARSVGIPARVVVGFTPGEPDEFGNFEITSHQAHAWVEVHLSNFGWLTIDPTPAGPLPGQAQENIGTPIATTTTTTAPPTTAFNEDSNPATTAPQEELQSANDSESTNFIPLVALLVGALAIGGIGFYSRKRYWEKEENVQNYVIQTFKQITRKILSGDSGPSLTINELQKKVPDQYVSINEFLDLLEDISYSPDSNVSLSELKEAATKARSEKVLIEN